MRLATRRSPLITIKLYRQNNSTGYQSASDKLFADAEIEENDSELRMMKEKLEQRLKQEQNWDGEENMQDTVLRMLVDKHKPLRSGPIRTADEKLKANPPKVGGAPVIDYEGNTITQEETNSGVITEHKPWMTTFKTPSFAVNPSIRAMKPQSASKRSQLDDVNPVKGPTREERLRIAEANRLASARERMIDYRYGGIKEPTATNAEGSRSNPKTMKGWNSLVEEKIEVRAFFGVEIVY
jgi:DnaJ family protein C protein 28